MTTLQEYLNNKPRHVDAFPFASSPVPPQPESIRADSGDQVRQSLSFEVRDTVVEPRVRIDAPEVSEASDGGGEVRSIADTETVTNEFDFNTEERVEEGRESVTGNSTVSIHTYVSPVTSTDYTGLEKIDPRLVDREWRLNNLYTVIDEDGKLVKFQLREAQKRILREMHHKNIILKARQLGFTTFICIFLLDYALFNQNKQIGIIGPTQVDTGVIFRKVKVAWENFPNQIKEFLHLKTIGDSKVEYEFSNGSIMRVSTSLRSGTYQAILITEFGKISARFPEKAEEIITGTLPAVPANGLVFIESTAEGEDGRFHEMCQDAMESKRLRRVLTIKDYRFHFFPWYENPSDQVQGDIEIPEAVDNYLNNIERLCHVKIAKEYRNWYFLEGKIQRGKMKQEHPSTPDEAFLSSGNKLFNGEKVEEHRLVNKREPIDVDGDFLIYNRFVKSHHYGLGADVSQGVKRDSSTIVVIDFTTGEVVLTYRSNTVDPVTFAHDIKKAALMYGGCIAAPESNNVGLTTCVTLNSIYPNIFTQVREGELEVKSTNKIGWLTTSLTKPKMMYELSEALDDDLIIIYDEGILLEMKRFNKEDTLQIGVTEATTRHFDLLIALAIAWQMRAYGARGQADPEDISKVEDRRDRNLHRVKGKYR